MNLTAEHPARERLLSAAENILLNKGARFLTTRAIGSAAQSNISQIRYYFGGLEGLLDALLAAELHVVSAAFKRGEPSTDRGHTVRTLMLVLLEALKTPALYTQGRFAASAIELIYEHAGEAMQAKAAAALSAAHAPFRVGLARQLPTLDDLTIKVRLAGVITLAMSLLPGNTGRRLLEVSLGGQRVSEARIQSAILEQCIAVWK